MQPSNRKTAEQKLVHINRRSFVSVLLLLLALMAVSIILTYVLPKGAYRTAEAGGETVVYYQSYVRLDNASGIPVWKGLLSPFLLLGTGDGINIMMLSVFLLVIVGTFQAMNDSNGIRAIVSRVVARFRNHRFLLLSIVALISMLFGAMLGLFEEMLTLLPVIAILTLSLGYDSFTGFLISVVACGFGFSSAITNPFTVLFASQLIGVNPMTNIWYRILVFAVMYGLIEGTLLLYTRKLNRQPESSFTYEQDRRLQASAPSETVPGEKKAVLPYLIFFGIVLAVLIVFSSAEVLRDYTVVALIAVFLIGGTAASFIASGFHVKDTLKSFCKGALSVLPTILFILMASSVKYILVEGQVLPTITHSINGMVAGRDPYSLALVLFLIVLVLEFFISSSTAKAIFVMSILSVLTLGLTKEMQVLIYTFADGYTNLLFPTSPVLLIGLSMIGFSYFKWVKKTWPLFAVTFSLVVGFLLFGIFIGY